MFSIKKHIVSIKHQHSPSNWMFSNKHQHSSIKNQYSPANTIILQAPLFSIKYQHLPAKTPYSPWETNILFQTPSFSLHRYTQTSTNILHQTAPFYINHQFSIKKQLLSIKHQHSPTNTVIFYQTNILKHPKRTPNILQKTIISIKNTYSLSKANIVRQTPTFSMHRYSQTSTDVLHKNNILLFSIKHQHLPPKLNILQQTLLFQAKAFASKHQHSPCTSIVKRAPTLFVKDQQCSPPNTKSLHRKTNLLRQAPVFSMHHFPAPTFSIKCYCSPNTNVLHQTPTIKHHHSPWSTNIHHALVFF